MTGDIWCNGAFSFESPLKDLLESGEYTLEQLLAEDELLQELRGVHPQLIEFFATEQAVTGLVKYVTLPPDGNLPSNAEGEPPSIPASSSMVSESLGDEQVKEAMDVDNEKTDAKPETEEDQNKEAGEAQDGEQAQKDAVFVRYPYMACEVICCEVKGIVDTLVDGYVPSDTPEEEATPAPESTTDQDGSNEEIQPDNRTAILDLLFDMLYDSEAGEIDDYRAGYFDKILSVLFRKRPQTLADYINSGGGKGQEVLMKAMFKHLYSHSIMQVLQRLLLPQPPLPQKNDDEDDDEDCKEGDELLVDPLENADYDGYVAFRCSWPNSDVALNMLLDCLIEKSPYPEIEGDEERRLSLYQNASEILITIIQNTPLSAPILQTLTTDPIMERLVKAATTVDEGESFSPHDSRQTCTMNVLESLILQLGGYGSVGMMYPEDEEDENGSNDENNEENKENGGEGSENQYGAMPENIATPETLIQHLPVMLSNLQHLLQCPETATWTSPMQFSNEPQKILGSSRLRIVRLLESLVLLGDPSVDSKLCESKCLETCLDLFWNFQWCSMLHQSVANLLVHIFEGANARAELQSYFLVKCNLLARLMDSFWEGAESVLETSRSESAFGNKSSSMDVEAGSSMEGAAAASEDGASAQNEDQQDDGKESATETPSKVPEELPPQSFRFGYMGHVIIICQALVHACSNESGDQSVEDTNASEANGELDDFVSRQNNDNKGRQEADSAGGLRRAESVTTEETPANPLILAQLVDSHELRKRWEDFVQSTLASETAIQSTPLGGFPGVGPGMDPLHAHRPGLAEDDDDDDDDGAAPPPPPRGLLVGGDVIDMDDNDLDVAASMMAGMSMGRGDGGARNDQDLLAGIPQQTGDGARGYMFDDPLGGARFGQFDDGNDSSDDDTEFSGKSGDSGGAVVEGVSGSAEHAPEAPVMDLFAGNFEGFEGSDQNGGNNQQDGDWSDFANFDNAFGDENQENATQEEDVNAAATTEEPSMPNGDIDEIFGAKKDHAELLEEDIEPPPPDESAKISSSEQANSSDEDEPVLEADTTS